MKKILFAAVFLVSACGTAPTLCVGAAIDADFLSTRIVVATIYFKDKSSFLSKNDKVLLNKVANVIEKSNNTKYLFRIEGLVARYNDQDGILRSFNLSKIVADYINLKTGNKLDIYITGLANDKSTTSPRFPDKVEIVRYENVIRLDTEAVDELVTDITNER